MQLRIAFTFEIFLPAVNGVINATANLAENLIREGHEVICIVPKWRKSPDFLLDGKVKTVPVPSFDSLVYPGLRFAMPLYTIPKHVIKKYGINIIHLTAPGSIGKRAIRVARALDIPIVQTWHTMLNDKHYLKHLFRFDTVIPLAQSIFWKYYKACIYNCGIITTPTEMITNIIKAQYPDIDVRTISNGLDIESFKKFGSLEELQAMLPNFDKNSLLFLGRVSQEKSIDVLLHALAKAVAINDRLKLFIVGDGPALPSLTKLAKKLNINHHLYFVGPWPHQKIKDSGILHYARAMVSASETETQGLTFIEAMCSDTPVIAADSEVTRDVIGNAGMLFPPKNSTALAECMLNITQDEVSYKAHAAACAQQVTYYDGKAVSKEFINLYYELLKHS